MLMADGHKNSSFIYKRAMAQQETGGKTWRVVTDVRKLWNGGVVSNEYETNLPTKMRAIHLTKLLNACL